MQSGHQNPGFAAASSDKTTSDDEKAQLVPLGKAQWKKLRYPPTCPVKLLRWQKHHQSKHQSQQQQSQLLLKDEEDIIVDAAFLDFDTGERKYKLKRQRAAAGMMVVSEKQLVFGRNARVWVVPPGEEEETRRGVVLYVRDDHDGRRQREGDEQVFYSVQLVDDEYRTVHHFVPAESVRYRLESTRDDGSTQLSSSQQSADNGAVLAAATRNQSSACQQSANSISQSAVSGQQQEHRRQQLKEVGDRTNNGESSSREPEQGPTAASFSMGPADDGVSTTNNNALREKNPSSVCDHETVRTAGSLSSTYASSLRQRRETAYRRKCLVLPIWVQTSTIVECFYQRRAWLEQETKCSLWLCGQNIENRPLLPVTLYVYMEGDSRDVGAAAHCIGETLCSSQEPADCKIVFMHDIALSNILHYRFQNFENHDGTRGRIMYQLSDMGGYKQWQWVWCSETFPSIWDLVHGARDLMIVPRGCVIVAGDCVDAVMECLIRVERRIDWLRTKYDRLVREK